MADNPFRQELSRRGNEPGLRPFKPGEFVENDDGSRSTEVTVTVPVGNEWVNAPSLWMSPKGPVTLSEDDVTGAISQYEQQTGQSFPRFSSVDEAVSAAKARSDQGGAFQGGITSAQANPFRQALEQRSRAPAEAGGESPSLLEYALDQNISSAKSFAGGVMDVIGLPADLTDIGFGLYESAGRTVGLDFSIPRLEGGKYWRDLGSKAGITHEPGKEPSAAGNRLSRILGGAVIPYGGVMARGQQLVRAGARGTGLVDDAARAAATRPGTTAALEGASISGATAGGELAEAAFPDSEVAEAIGELAGGFAPSVAMSGPAATLAKKSLDLTNRAAFPFTKAGGKIRASRRLQSAAADPEQAAARVGGSETLSEAKLSPARLTGDKRLLAIERAVANQDPALDARLTEDLSAATRVSRQMATDMGGDSARVRNLLENRREYLVDLVRKRSKMAADQAQEAVSMLDPNATPRQISRAARESVESALSDAQATETQLWESLDKKAPATLSSSREALREELAKRSKFEDPADIPPWLKKALRSGRNPKVAAPGVTFGDVHALRKRVGSLIGKERAEASPNRNKLRILSDIYDSLLEDMGSAEGQGEALGSALAFSRELNQKFRQGAVGRLLGYERRGGLSVSPEDTLRRVVSGEASGTQVRQFIEADPESAQQIANYLRSAFMAQTIEDGKFSVRAGMRFLRKHDEVLEQFPELRAELTNAREMNRRAQRLYSRKEAVERLAYNSKKSRAALYLDGPLGEEWNRVLRAENPEAVAASLRRKVRGDKKAVQGLKSSFVEELLKRSEYVKPEEKDLFVSGARFDRMLEDYAGVANALGMTGGEKARLKRVANTFSRIDTKPSGKEAILEDQPAAILDLIARLIGAKSGQRIAGSGMGSSMVMANAFSQRMRATLQKLTRDKASELVAASIEDPELFRALMEGPTSSYRAQQRAVQRINAWLAAPAAEQAQEQPE